MRRSYSFRFTLTAAIAVALVSVQIAVAAEPNDDGKLRIICFGAHPDDCEIRAGGAAILWSDAGHHVKFVSATNGDIGHWAMAGGPLAQRRNAEVQEAAKILGTTTEVLDIHDGEIMPTLENRRTFTRLMRQWNADIVIGHRPNDYHPDHRYTGVLMQDSAYMVAVPFFCPDVPPLRKNPVFLYSFDRFQRPNPFRPDVVVSIEHSRDNTYPVVGASGELIGVIRYRELRSALFDPELSTLVRAADVTTPARWVLHPDEPVARIHDMFEASKDDCLPVVAREEPYRFVGLVRRRDVLRLLIREHGES